MLMRDKQADENLRWVSLTIFSSQFFQEPQVPCILPFWVIYTADSQVKMRRVLTTVSWTCEWEGSFTDCECKWRYQAPSWWEIGFSDMGGESIWFNTWSWTKNRCSSHPGWSSARVPRLVLIVKLRVFFVLHNAKLLLCVIKTVKNGNIDSVTSLNEIVFFNDQFSNWQIGLTSISTESVRIIP